MRVRHFCRLSLRRVSTTAHPRRPVLRTSSERNTPAEGTVCAGSSQAILLRSFFFHALFFWSHYYYSWENYESSSFITFCATLCASLGTWEDMGPLVQGATVRLSLSFIPLSSFLYRCPRTLFFFLSIFSLPND